MLSHDDHCLSSLVLFRSRSPRITAHSTTTCHFVCSGRSICHKCNRRRRDIISISNIQQHQHRPSKQRMFSLHQIFSVTILLGMTLATISGFRVSIPTGRRYSSVALRMSSTDPFEAIKAKMAQDPSYDPMKDPQAMQQLEAMIPTEMREFANSIERFKVAFTDAGTGSPAIDDLDSLSSVAATMKGSELISSPTSAWFKAGAPDEPFDENELKEALEDAKRDFPEIPL